MERKKGIDLCKLIALLFVFFIHYIGWSGFFENVQDHVVHYWLIMACTQIVIACVPLFLIITGFLSASIKLGRNYHTAYKTFNIYIFYSLLLILTAIYKFKSVYSPKMVLNNLLGIRSIINREWYVSYYILLLLFIPFFNQLWKALRKNDKRYLILILFLSTSLTQSIYIILSISFFNLEFANQMYVLIYFFIGKYFADYGLEIEKKYLYLLLNGTIFISSLYFGLLYYGKLVDASCVIRYGRTGTVLIAVSIFGLLYDVDLKCKIYLPIKYGAKASLDTYLGALPLEYLLFHLELKGADFLKKSFPYLVLIIIITIVLGNFRQYISSRMICKGGGSTLVNQVLVTVLLVSVIYMAIVFARYPFFPNDLTVNNGRIDHEEIYATEAGCVTSGPYINLTPGRWIAEIYYDVSNEGNYIDAVYYDKDGEAKQYAVWNLADTEKYKKIELNVEEGSSNWEIRTFYSGLGQMRIKKLLLKKL